jgi:ppGpp synthetase/RelA/SpoT-type nucleotidyltranferase
MKAPSGLSDDNRRFLAEYSANFPNVVEQAARARDFVLEALRDKDYELHLINARAKDPDSVRGKLLLKGYKEPQKQLTDQIGVRCITYYAEQVDRIVARLRQCFSIDEGNSSDKRLALGEAAFGYRSVHLVAKPKRTMLREARFKPLQDKYIEVQVRSVLDHAWAEVEHEIVYKSGILHVEEFKRRFSAVAGTLEVLEYEFLRLKAERESLIEKHIQSYSMGREKGVELDAVRLIALLEVAFPEGKGWRKAFRVGSPFAVRTEKTCVDALRAVGIETGTQLLQLFRRVGFQNRLETYASNASISALEASHPSIIVLAVGYKDVDVMRDFFPELAESPPIAETFS